MVDSRLRLVPVLSVGRAAHDSAANSALIKEFYVVGVSLCAL